MGVFEASEILFQEGINILPEKIFPSSMSLNLSLFGLRTNLAVFFIKALDIYFCVVCFEAWDILSSVSCNFGVSFTGFNGLLII